MSNAMKDLLFRNYEELYRNCVENLGEPDKTLLYLQKMRDMYNEICRTPVPLRKWTKEKGTPPDGLYLPYFGMTAPVVEIKQGMARWFKDGDVSRLCVEIVCDCEACESKPSYSPERLREIFTSVDWESICDVALDAGWKVPDDRDEDGEWIHPDHIKSERTPCPYWAHEEEQETCEKYERSHNRTCWHLVRPFSAPGRDIHSCGAPEGEE